MNLYYFIILAAFATTTNGQNSINSISFVISIALIMIGSPLILFFLAYQ